MGYMQTDSVFILDMKANNNEYIDRLCGILHELHAPAEDDV